MQLGISGLRLGEQDAEVLHQHSGHVPLDAGHAQLLGHLVDDGGLATTGGTLDADGTTDGEQGLQGFFQQSGSHVRLQCCG